MKEEIFTKIREKKKELEDRLMVCTHNCINDFLKDTGIIVERVSTNLTPVRSIGYNRPTTLLVDVKIDLEEL
jgi:hypothetical protein